MDERVPRNDVLDSEIGDWTGWSDWTTVMKLEPEEGDGYEARANGHAGFRCNAEDLRRRICNRRSGVCELRKVYENHYTDVVHIGVADMNSGVSLHDYLSSLCNGAVVGIEGKVVDVLKNHGHLEARYCACPQDEVNGLFTSILRDYAYAWRVENGKINRRVKGQHSTLGSRRAWSGWKTIMKKFIHEDQDFKKRGNQITGCRLKARHLQEFVKELDDGVYEWMTVDPEGAKEVVYAGESDSRNENSLYTRVNTYCTNGSHKADEFNKALDRGCKIQVRWVGVQDEMTSEEMENYMLDMYEYPWNIRGN